MEDQSIRFRCKKCSTKLKAQSPQSGKRFACPNCGNAIAVPVLSENMKVSSSSSTEPLRTPTRDDSAAFDPYRKWLGIPPEEQPPNDYRLLGIPLFQDDPEAIQHAADQRMLFLKTLRVGDHAATVQRLLNEVAAARVNLLDPERREAYNGALAMALQRKAAKRPRGPSLPLGEKSGNRLPRTGQQQREVITDAPRIDTRPRPIEAEVAIQPPPVIPHQQKPEPTISSQERIPAALPYIKPSQLQVQGETSILFATLAVAAALFVFVSLSTVMIFAVLLLIAYFGVKSHQQQLRKTAFRVTSESNPTLDSLIQTAARRLTMPTPELFVEKNADLNAYATGFDCLGTVVLNSGIVEAMTPDELLFIIGHELTHIKCRHCKYLVFTNATVGTVVNRGIAFVMDIVFKLWNRKAEFTSDRGGIIACKKPTTAMMALARLEIHEPSDIQEFIQTAVRGTPAVDDWFATHPDTSNRIAAIAHYGRTRGCAQLTALWN